MRYLKFGQLLRRVSRLMLILKHLHSFLNLSEILVEAAEVDGALAVIVHDVAAQLPDGALELVAVELELREPPPDALERMQQSLGLLPHALLDGRHDGLLGVALLAVHVDERPHQLPLVLRILLSPLTHASTPASETPEIEGPRVVVVVVGRWRPAGRQTERQRDRTYLGAAARLVEGAAGVGREAEGAGDGRGGGARGGRRHGRAGWLGFWVGARAREPGGRGRDGRESEAKEGARKERRAGE